VKKEIIRTMERKRVAKYYDTSLKLLTSTNVVGFQCLSLVPQGVAQNQRVADTIIVYRLDIRFYAFLSTNAVDYTDFVRSSYFMWKANSAIDAPNSTDIYQDAGLYSVLSPFSFETRELYSILRDYTTTLSGVTGAPTAASICNITDSISLANHRIQFGIGLTTGTGHLYFADYSDSATSPHPSYSLVTRLWYYDED